MRAWVLVLGLAAGCQLSLHATGGQTVDTGGTTGVGGTTSGAGSPAGGDDNGEDPPPSPAPVPPADLSLPGSEPDMALPAIGAPCTTDPDCGGSPRVCGHDFKLGATTIHVPGGYCTMSCSQAQCPSGSECVAFSFGNWCESTCPVPDPCGRKGYSCCKPAGAAANACLPAQLCPAPGPG